MKKKQGLMPPRFDCRIAQIVTFAQYKFFLFVQIYSKEYSQSHDGALRETVERRKERITENNRRQKTITDDGKEPKKL